MKIAITSLLTLAIVSPLAAQNLSKDVICRELVPPMLEFVGSVEDLPENFDAIYQQLSAEDRATFRGVQDAGADLNDAVNGYRAAFILACFSD